MNMSLQCLTPGSPSYPQEKLQPLHSKLLISARTSDNQSKNLPLGSVKQQGIKEVCETGNKLGSNP